MKPLSSKERGALDALLTGEPGDGGQDTLEEAFVELAVRGLVVIKIGLSDDDTTITLTDLGALAYRVDAAARTAGGAS